MSRLVHQPSPERIERALMTRFLRQVAAEAPEVRDYPSLWRWSVDNPAAFWSRMWDFGGIVGEKGEVVVEHLETHARGPLLPAGEAQFREEPAAPARRASGARRLERKGAAAAALLRRALRRGRPDGQGARRARHPARRPGRGLSAQHSRSGDRHAGRRQPGRHLVVLLARFRGAGRLRPLRPDQAADPLHRRRLHLRRQGFRFARPGARGARRRSPRSRKSWWCRCMAEGPALGDGEDPLGGLRGGRAPKRSLSPSCPSTSRST